jgi:hypothetical protein
LQMLLLTIIQSLVGTERREGQMHKCTRRSVVFDKKQNLNSCLTT